VSGLSPLDDQRVAAGLMWFAGMVPFNIAIVAAVGRLLNAEEGLEHAPATERDET
jgi:hypothetical protein